MHYDGDYEMKNQILMGINGDESVAYATKQVNPDVVAAYPITPQTIIVEKYSEYVADGEVDTEFVAVESEHSALSSCVGAAAAGARAFTATASAGLGGELGAAPGRSAKLRQVAGERRDVDACASQGEGR